MFRAWDGGLFHERNPLNHEAYHLHVFKRAMQEHLGIVKISLSSCERIIIQVPLEGGTGSKQSGPHGVVMLIISFSLLIMLCEVDV